MHTLKRDEANREWIRLWSNLKSNWFKLEVLQDYSGEDRSASLDAWMNGEKEKSIDLLRTTDLAWFRECGQKVASGIRLTRIHIVVYPLSPYLDWEIEAYKARNISIGKEHVYILDKRNCTGIDIPSGDVMIFDNESIVANAYSRKGRMVSETFYETSDDVSSFIELRNRILKSKLIEIIA